MPGLCVNVLSVKTAQ